MKFLLCVSFFIVSTYAQADWWGSSKSTPPPSATHSSSLRPQHELMLNFSPAALNRIAFGGGDVSLGFGGGYNYRLIEMLQLARRAEIVHASAGAVSVTQFQFLAGALVNFHTNWKFEDEFFAGALMGIQHTSVGVGSTTPFVFDIEVGKRFLLFPNFCFRPMFSLIIPTNGNSVVGIVHLLSVSLVF